MAEQSTGVTKELVVDEEGSGERLDLYLADVFPDLSRTKIQKLIKEGGVSLNGRPCKAKDPVNVGDRIFFTGDLLLPKVLQLTPRPVDLPILYEDEHVIVIDKPKGLVVHPGAGTTEPTLVEGLLHYLGRNAIPGELRPGIVHRLDKDTSGVLVCAKSELALRRLGEQFAAKTNLREYVALCDGVPREPELLHESYLYRDPHHRQKFRSLPSADYATRRAEQGGDLQGYRYAKSKFFLERAFADRLSLMRIRLFTGRTHQIRIHAKDLKIPIVGDPLYHGPVKLPSQFPKGIIDKVESIHTQLLHARVLGFAHPVTGEKMAFEAAMPREFKELVQLLEDYCR